MLSRIPSDSNIDVMYVKVVTNILYNHPGNTGNAIKTFCIITQVTQGKLSKHCGQT